MKQMRIKQLIELLSRCDPNSNVVYNGAKALHDLGLHAVDSHGNGIAEEELYFDIDRIETVHQTCILNTSSLEELINGLSD